MVGDHVQLCLGRTTTVICVEYDSAHARFVLLEESYTSVEFPTGFPRPCLTLEVYVTTNGKGKWTLQQEETCG